MVEEVLIFISLIIGLAAVITILAKAIKQPPIIAYLISGILVSPLFLNLISPKTASSDFIQILAHIGVALLLFIVGLSLDFRILKDVWGVSALAGLGEIIVTTLIGFLIAIALGFNSALAIYIAIALAFSSTVVVVKILSDKKEMDTLHAKIAVGILIVEDFVAAIVLMLIPIIKNGGESLIFIQLAKIIGLIAVIFVFSVFILNKLLHYLAKNQETLFLFGIAWALILATVFNYLGFSLEIGALIAGMSLASSKYTLELGGKIKPLRDFFVVLFFVFFGSQLAGPITSHLVLEALAFSAFILAGKPLIVMTFIKFFGFKKRTTFLAGLSLAQISEFSLILVLLGFNLGYLSQEVMSLAVLVSLITIAISSYNIYYSHSIFNRISHLLNIFEGEKDEETGKKEIYDIILFGYNRIGFSLLRTLNKIKAKYIVVDYNPRVILELSKKRINCVYGDASDKEFIDELQLDKTKLVISTIPDMDSSLTIKERLDEVKSSAVFIATSEHINDAIDLYKAGADYVIVPQVLGGECASTIVQAFHTNKKKYKQAGRENIKELQKRLKD